MFSEFLEFSDRSDKTIRSYRKTLCDFELWLWQTKEISDIKIITFKEIKEYREVLINNYAPASINLKLCAIKAFYKYLFQQNIINFDPSENIKIQKVSDNIKSQYLTRGEELKIMSQAKAMGKKTFAILMIMLKCGLRPSEVSKLSISSVYLKDNPTLIIKNSKRNKSRYVPIPADTVLAIKEWLVIREKSNNIIHQRSEYLFTSQRAVKMGERAIQRVIENVAKKANIKLYCTRLRCSYANNLIQEAKIPVNILANLLGHENVSTTGRYLTASEHDVRKYVNKLSEI